MEYDLKKSALWYAAKMNWAVFPCWWPESTGDNAKCACGKTTCDRIGKHPIWELVTEVTQHHEAAPIRVI